MAELSYSPGRDQSSPGWCREVLGVQGAPQGSRSIPRPAGEPESLLSASYQPVCPLALRGLEVWDTEFQESPPSNSSKGDRALTCFLVCAAAPACTHCGSQIKNKQVKEQSSACLSVCAWAADYLNTGLQRFGNTNKSICYVSHSERQMSNDYMLFYTVLYVLYLGSLCCTCPPLDGT